VAALATAGTFGPAATLAAGASGVDAGCGVGAGTAAGEVAAARLTEVVSGTVSTRPGRRCALVRRWFSSASDSMDTP
jgi:hypothetical protein